MPATTHFRLKTPILDSNDTPGTSPAARKPSGLDTRCPENGHHPMGAARNGVLEELKRFDKVWRSQPDSEMDGDQASEISACETLEYDEWESEVDDFELEQDSRLIKAVVFSQPHTQPIQRLLYCSVETRFKFMSYPVAQDTDPGAEYLVYSVYSEKYRDAGQPINLTGRGRLMVFRENTLRRIDCPGIKTWERRARQSAQAEAIKFTMSATQRQIFCPACSSPVWSTKTLDVHPSPTLNTSTLSVSQLFSVRLTQLGLHSEPGWPASAVAAGPLTVNMGVHDPAALGRLESRLQNPVAEKPSTSMIKGERYANVDAALGHILSRRDPLTRDGNFNVKSKAKSECDYSDTDYSDMPDLQDVSDSEEE
ncbi:hypothetical protein DFH06DRAFT_1146026 [Mycena polygramma]|nr:hypothetical protein DFH06DRAFT_1146026 [Mycena polygramma]